VIGEIINLPKITDARGNLSVIEEFAHIPFEIKRTYLMPSTIANYFSIFKKLKINRILLVFNSEF